MTSLEKPWYLPALESFLLEDVPARLGLPRARFERDFSTLVQRLAAEGESFLTKTLSTFAQSFDLALQGGQPLSTTAFRKCGKTALPHFCGGLLRLIFRNDGYVRDDASVEAIRLMRQLLLWCKKIRKGYSDETLRNAVVDFVNIDRSLPRLECIRDRGALEVGRAVVESIFNNSKLALHTLSPKHGPGAVSNYVSGAAKRELKFSYRELEKVFRPVPWFRSLRDVAENPASVTERVHKTYGLSKMAAVEKDSGGPRLIGLEPAEYQWCQQALKSWLYRYLENNQLTAGQINFEDQTVNQRLTSRWQDFETLDLSKASDRLSYEVVQYLFRNTRLWVYLDASRTRGTVLLNGEDFLYKKFAPMGSAVCFPVQAVCFFALACAALHLGRGMPLLLAMRSIFVYGDDLVVPRGSFPYILKEFENVGLKLNTNKCCVGNNFRESCGVDSFDGNNVTPVRMRRVGHGENGFSPLTIISVVKHANNLMLQGYHCAARAFKKAALESDNNLRSLRLPTLRTQESILHWFDPELGALPRIKIRCGIPCTSGWIFSPSKLEGNPQHEMMYLRSSLASGGVVGQLNGGPKVKVKRTFTQRFQGRLVHKRAVRLAFACDAAEEWKVEHLVCNRWPKPNQLRVGGAKVSGSTARTGR